MAQVSVREVVGSVVLVIGALLLLLAAVVHTQVNSPLIYVLDGCFGCFGCFGCLGMVMSLCAGVIVFSAWCPSFGTLFLACLIPFSIAAMLGGWRGSRQ